MPSQNPAQIKLSDKSRQLIVQYVNKKIEQFPRDEMVERFKEYEKSFHLSTENPNANKVDNNLEDAQDGNEGYYRYKDLDIGVVKTVGEADHTFYVSSLLSETPIFPVISPNKDKPAADMMNAKIEKDQRFSHWDSNLSKCFLSGAKYNLLAAEVHWSVLKTKHLVATGTGEVAQQDSVWRGNKIKYISPYNLCFDTTVSPEEVAMKGDHAGYTERMTQIALWEYLRELKAIEPDSVYEEDEMWQSSNQSHIKFDPIRPMKEKRTGQIKDSTGTNWDFEFGFTDPTKKAKENNLSYRNTYIVWTFYLRIIPKLFHINVPNDEEPQIWRFTIVNGMYLAAAFQVNDYHKLLNIVISQATLDDLGLDCESASGQIQPMQKVIKQLLDRGFAFLDRAVSDRALFDEEYLNKEDVNSRIPDAKIPLRKNARRGSDIGDTNKLEKAYRQLPFDSRGIDQIFQTISMMIEFAQYSAGLNRAQLGHFVKGNKTREEFTQIMNNANSKQFVRAMVIGMTFLGPIKQIIKTNILQYQMEGEQAYSTQGRNEVTISPEDIRNASLEFKLLDGLNPRSTAMSPEFYEFFIRMTEQIPTLNEKYSIEDMIAHLVQIAGGINMSQYEREEPLPPQTEEGNVTENV